MNRETANQLLEEIADELNIPDGTLEKAVNSYTALGEYINNNSNYSVDIYPQGSIRLGTAIKPINEDDDYDIDLVALVHHQFRDAKNLKFEIGNVLKNSDRYSKMLEDEGRRCWTIKYAEDAHFHMDVLPSQDDIAKDDDTIMITDKIGVLYSFRSSNPKGYAKWFYEKAKFSSEHFYNSIEPIKTNSKRSTLQKTVQLLKRHRDIAYSNKSEEESENKPISIIITTVATRLYSGKENVLELMEKFATSWKTCFEEDYSGNLILRNPVDNNENFADKWIEKPSKKLAFVEWANSLKTDLSETIFPVYTDRVKEASHLKTIFGTKVVESVYSRNAEKIVDPYISKSQDSIGITKEKTDTPVKKHTFYGNDKNS